MFLSYLKNYESLDLYQSKKEAEQYMHLEDSKKETSYEVPIDSEQLPLRAEYEVVENTVVWKMRL